MATTHFHRTVYKSGGHLATGRITYMTGAAVVVPAEARIEHQGLAAVTKQRREDLVEWNHANLPQWAEGNPIRYFRAAQDHEGVGRIAYTEWRFSLPRDLTRAQYLDAAHDFLTAAFGTRNPYVYAVHAPQASDGSGEQPHVHVLWSGRVNDGIARTPETYFKWYNVKHPERGGALKDPWTWHLGSVKASRVQYTDIMNAALARHGHGARLHPDRLTARGFTRDAEPVGLPSDSNKAKYWGEITETRHAILTHRRERLPHEPAELAQAQAYWIMRSAALGLTPDMTPAEQREWIIEARQQCITQTPTRMTREERAAQRDALTADGKALVHLAAALHVEIGIEGQYEAQGLPRPPSGIARMEHLLAAVGDPEAAARAVQVPAVAIQGPALARTVASARLRWQVQHRGQETEAHRAGGLNVQVANDIHASTRRRSVEHE